MHQLKIGSIPLPKIYVCEQKEAKECRRLGVPFIIKPKTWSDEKLIIAVLWRTLHKKFPNIDWIKVLKVSNTYQFRHLQVNYPVQPEVEVVSSQYRDNPGYDTCGFSDSAMQVTEDNEYRMTGGGLDPDDKLDFDDEARWEKQTIDDYIGDLSYQVNIDELQTLKLLPKFLDDITNAIKINLMNTAWCDGYNKKLGCNLGRWDGVEQAPNLIILDTSGSIPSGIASTMITLIDTLRHQANADLIITSRRSEYWAANTELPDPDKLSYLIGGCNERVQFYAILRKHIFGKHWGNVIIFGDNDAPDSRRLDTHVAIYSANRDPDYKIKDNELQSTKIDRIMAFHTYQKKIPGYGLWAKKAAPKAEVVINTDWAGTMKGF